MWKVPGPAELQGDGTELRARRPPAVELNDGAGELGGGALGVVLPLEDAVEELSALAELHDEVQAIIVLAHLAQPQHPAVAELRHAARDLHFPPLFDSQKVFSTTVFLKVRPRVLKVDSHEY